MSLSAESSARCESAIVEEYITKLRRSLACRCTLAIDNVLLLRLARWTEVETSRSSPYPNYGLSLFCHSSESNCTAVAQLQLPEVASTLTLRSVQACEGIVGWLSHESCKRSRRPCSTGQGSVHHTSTDTPAGKWFASRLTAASLFGRSYLCGTLRYYPSASIKLRLSMAILPSKTQKGQVPQSLLQSSSSTPKISRLP